MFEILSIGLKEKLIYYTSIFLKKTMRIVLLLLFQLIITLISSKNSLSQDFGGHPYAVQWKQIRTGSFRIIFPEGMEKQANRSANLITYMLSQKKQSIGELAKFTNIVFQNRTTIANGYVGYAPLRSEFFCTPTSSPYTLASITWMDALTIHEYRHVLQLSNTRIGITKILSFAFGDYAWAAASNLNIPDWYYEGDAVMAETALTNGGRGRLPYFSLSQRALLSNNLQYSYMKARNGSYKDLVPSHYPLGYAQINYARNKFGLDIWKEVVNDASKYKGLFYTFSRNLKKRTGYSTKMLYTATYDSLKQDYIKRTQEKSISNTITVKTSPIKKTFTNYTFPSINKKGSLLCLKTSFKETPKIIEIDTAGNETNLVNLGFGDNGYYTHKNSELIWTERRYDPRWGNQNYSVIVSYNLITKKRKTLTHKTKYFSPELSYDGEKIVVNEALPNGQYSIKILTKNNGEVLKKLPNPNNYYFYYPKWTADDESIISVVQNTEGLFGMVLINTKTENYTTLIDFTNHLLATPFVTKETVYFSATFNGTDNIYTINLQTKKISQLTSVLLGAYQPYLKESTLYFSEFNHRGYYLSKINIDSLKPIEIKLSVLNQPERYQTKSIQEEGGNILQQTPNKKYEVKKYRKLAHPINIHSWYPIIDANTIDYTVVSENILKTLEGTASYRFNRNDQSSSILGNISYGGLYPIISAGANQMLYRSFYYKNDNETIDTLRWNENNYNVGIKIPLNFSKGLYNSRLTLQTNLNQHIIKYSEKSSLRFASLSSSLRFSNVRRQALQNVGPRLAQLFTIEYNTGIKYAAQSLSLNTTFYFPGLFKNHSFYIGAAFKTQTWTTEYIFADNFYFARGYSAVRSYKSIFKRSLNYHLPVSYPDFGFWGIFYLKRIRSNFFADFSIVNGFMRNDLTSYNSVGMELLFETRLLNLVPLSFGTRESILLNKDPNFPNRKHYPDLILNINF